MNEIEEKETMPESTSRETSRKTGTCGKGRIGSETYTKNKDAGDL